MKILEIVADGRPAGGTTIVLSLLEDLQARTSWRLAFCSQSDSYAVARARALNIEAMEIDLFRGRLNPAYLLHLRRIIRKASPDLIHVHGSRAALWLTIALGRRRPSLIYTVHGYQFTHKTPLMRFLAIRAERFISKQADLTLFVSRYDQHLSRATHLSDRGVDQVIYNGIETAGLPTAAPESHRIVVALGRLDYPKNPQLVVQVAALLREEGFTFWFIGGGELDGELRAMVVARGLSEQVKFFGVLDREAALVQAAKAAMLIMPSRWEGLPLAPIEAMAMGLPVVASRVSGIPEIIEDGVTGFLLDQPDPVAYADRLRRLATDDALYARIKAAGRDHVLKTFSRDRMVAEHIALYRRFLPSESKDRS